MVGHTRRFNPSHQWVKQRIDAGEFTIQAMDIETFFFRRKNINAKGEPRSWTDHLLWHHSAHSIDLFQYMTGSKVVRANILQGPKHPELGLWATIERSTGAFLGRCGLLPWQIEGRHEVELAFLIDKSRWREGFASEAAAAIVAHAGNVLRLERLICLIMPGNMASAGVARKVGMSFERELTDDFGLCHIYSRALPAAQ